MGPENKRHSGIHRTGHRVYTRNLDFEQFRFDIKTFDAVVRNFEIIGEAASHVPEEIVADHPEIPWQDMRDMRNALAHEYFGINENIVWDTIQNDLLPLVTQLKSLLEREGV